MMSRGVASRSVTVRRYKMLNLLRIAPLLKSLSFRFVLSAFRIVVTDPVSAVEEGMRERALRERGSSNVRKEMSSSDIKLPIYGQEERDVPANKALLDDHRIPTSAVSREEPKKLWPGPFSSRCAVKEC